MLIELIWYRRFLGTVSLATALVLVFLAYRGYLKTQSRALLSGALGFGMIGIGALLEGILFEFIGVPFESADIIGATFNAVGLLILLYSIHRTS